MTNSTSINTTNAIPAGATPNPFGNSLQFLEVTYPDQINGIAPPVLQISAFMPAPSTVTADGLTLELWFKALSSGSLVSVPMSNGQATAAAPLIYIDTNGLLRAGLFDSTQITLYSGQNLICQNNNGLINIGAPNTLQSPLSVIDGEWHHAALVVQPGAKGTQTLYLDGRLAGSSTGNGSFGLSFVASDGTTWNAQTPSGTTLGGSITPELIVSATPFPSLAQGFCGCLNELRTWYGPRSVSGIQQLIDEPLALNFNFYHDNEGLAGYVGAGVFSVIQPTAYLVTTSDAPPVDPFTDVTNRVPGFQNFGICMAIPFTTAAPEISFQASQTYSTKISLRRADQLQVSFPTTDAAGDDFPLNTYFSMTLTGGVSGQIQNTTQITPGSQFTISPSLTDCYRFDFTCSATVTIDNLQFMLVPGPLNTLMQLLLDILPLQTAYTDPNYPTTPTTLPDPRHSHSGSNVTLSPYWPLFTDQTAFPIDSTNQYTASDLLKAYLHLNDAARELSQKSGPTFADFFNLSLNQAKIYQVGDISTLLDQAYAQVAKKPAPVPVPTTFNSAVDQVYAFIYNANLMRTSLNEFLTAYQAWAQIIINYNEQSLAQIPAKIANQICTDQESVETSPLKGPSAGDFVLNLLLGSVLWGLGAVLGPLVLPAEFLTTVTATAIAVGFAGSAGANALSELCGAFIGSSTVQATLKPANYSTIQDVVNNITKDLNNAYNTILTNLIDPVYLQTLYSNYGLLQALRFVNAQPLNDANQPSVQAAGNSSMATALTYTSWKELIPSVFTWSAKSLTDQVIEGNTVVFNVTPGCQVYSPNTEMPASLGIFEVLQGDPLDAFYWMLYQIQQWQTVTGSQGGQFFSVCPIFYSWDGSVLSSDWVIAWSLSDQNNNSISPDLVTALFGNGTGSNPLKLADQNNPLAAAGYGWYVQIAKSGVTTPFDAFMNWGEAVPSYIEDWNESTPSYSTRVLLAEFLIDRTMYGTYIYAGYPVWFAAVAASDMPPPAIVTLEPSALSFGDVTIGSSSQLTAVLTNNQIPPNSLQQTQQKSFQNISATSSSSAFVVTAPTEVQVGQTGTVTVTFEPGASDTGPQSGTITITGQGQWNSISLTLACSGTGVQSTN